MPGDRLEVFRAIRLNRRLDPNADETYILLWTIVLYVTQVMAGIGGMITFFGVWIAVLW